MAAPCPLCNSPVSLTFQAPDFYKCPVCELIFKNSHQHLSPEAEKSRYQLHTNSIDEPGYVQFLSPVLNAVKEHVKSGSRGLDYGCGPSPVLSKMLANENYEMTNYDPFFYPNDFTNLQLKYDFITCTEAAEHFYKPGEEFRKIFSLLNPSGTLVIMTEQYKDDVRLLNWYYAKDPTHVCFFNLKTFLWLASHFGRSVQIINHRVAVFGQI